MYSQTFSLQSLLCSWSHASKPPENRSPAYRLGAYSFRYCSVLTYPIRSEFCLLFLLSEVPKYMTNPNPFIGTQSPAFLCYIFPFRRLCRAYHIFLPCFARGFRGISSRCCSIPRSPLRRRKMFCPVIKPHGW